MSLSNYPSGVSGNEPQITGIWPCCDCDGAGYDADEDGKHNCPRCKGSGTEPEDYDLDYLKDLVYERSVADYRIEPIVEWVRCISWDRSDPIEREYLRAVLRLRALTR